MNHLGIREFMVLGFCIGGPFIWNLLQRAGDRVVAAVPAQPSGYRPEMPDLSYNNNMKGWGPQRLTQLQAAAQVAEQARDTAKAQLAALQLDADAVTRNLDESRVQAASPLKSASPVARPSSSSGPRARRGVRRHD
jgi:pimeloyl-ACP methyl ester carboxylesterase